MLKCKSFCSELTLNRVQIVSGVLSVLIFLLESFLSITSILLFMKSAGNALIISIFIISVSSSLLMLVFFALTIKISADFSKNLQYLCFFLIISYLGVVGGQLYLSIFISNLSNFLVSEVTLCENSEVFAQIYWEYQKLYYICGESAENCECFHNSTCVLPIIIDFYNNFQCDGFCNSGKIDCSGFITQVIKKIGSIYVAVNSLCVGFLIILIGCLVLMIKIKASERPKLAFTNRNLRSFRGISRNNTGINNAGNSLDFGNISAIRSDDQSVISEIN